VQLGPHAIAPAVRLNKQFACRSHHSKGLSNHFVRRGTSVN
jgi:hypothetical protein